MLVLLVLLLTACVFHIADSEWAPCPKDWAHFRSSNKCYKVVKYINLEHALLQCSRHGATLASINSWGENDFVLGYARKLNISRLLIGMRKNTDFGWEWIDGSPYAYTLWERGLLDRPGVGQCAQMKVDSKATCGSEEWFEVRYGCWTRSACNGHDPWSGPDADDGDEHDALCQRTSDTGTSVIEEVSSRIDDVASSVQKLSSNLQQIKCDLELVGRHLSGRDGNDDRMRSNIGLGFCALVTTISGLVVAFVVLRRPCDNHGQGEDYGGFGSELRSGRKNLSARDQVANDVRSRRKLS